MLTDEADLREKLAGYQRDHEHYTRCLAKVKSLAEQTEAELAKLASESRAMSYGQRVVEKMVEVDGNRVLVGDGIAASRAVLLATGDLSAPLMKKTITQAINAGRSEMRQQAAKVAETHPFCVGYGETVARRIRELK